jgi:hypothetical protein
VELAQGKYKDVNDHHLTGKLKEQEKIELSREKVSRIPSSPRDRVPAGSKTEAAEKDGPVRG